jgi:protein-S-isoprenylcysteine O-methyltransferase Ste14
MTWAFLIPLVLGFISNAASAFTGLYSRQWGERGGQAANFILRNVLGIPAWATGFVLAAQASSRRLILTGGLTVTTGWILVAVGGVIILWALRSLGRRAVAPSARDTLVADGPYRYVRHPIHAGAFLEFVGLWLLVPSLAVIVACVLGIGWLWVQTILEEADLRERVPGYRQYMASVPRFVPQPRREQSMRREVISLRDSLRPLQDQFNAGYGRMRFLALLSPT